MRQPWTGLLSTSCFAHGPVEPTGHRCTMAPSVTFWRTSQGSRHRGSQWRAGDLVETGFVCLQDAEPARFDKMSPP